MSGINADLTPAGIDVTQAQILAENGGTSFQGTSKKASFNIDGALARQWLVLPNPNGKPNSDVVRRWSNGLMLAGRASDGWIIDYGTDVTEGDASLYDVTAGCKLIRPAD